ncbi:MAG: hypothetical protein H6704_28225 [Myxococcales bacterium]|nr:hypothetical protein [Myxococcales bacterium]
MPEQTTRRRWPRFGGWLLWAVWGAAGCDSTHVGNPQDEPPAVYRCDGADVGVPLACDGPPLEKPVTAEADLLPTLASACPGDTVRLAEATYTADVDVPPGVTLAGAGATVVGTTRACLQAGGPRTALLGVTLRGAFSARGGPLKLAEVTVEAARGVGVQLTDAETEVETLTVLGLPLEAAAPQAIDPARTPVAGVLVEGGTFAADGLRVEGSVGFGVVLREVESTVVDGVVERFWGTGVLVEGGQATLTEVQVDDGRTGSDVSLVRAFGVVASAGAALTTSDLQVQGVDGVGVLQVGATGAHRQPTVRDNGGPGFWVQDAADRGVAGLSVTGGTLIANAGAGIALRDAGDVVIADTTVEATGALLALDGIDPTPVADGLQVTAPSGLLALRGLQLLDNPRAGLLIDGEGADAPTFDVAQVTVRSAVDDALGAYVQRLDDLELDGVTVEPDLAANDAAAEAEGRVLEVLEPTAAPAADAVE